MATAAQTGGPLDALIFLEEEGEEAGHLRDASYM